MGPGGPDLGADRLFNSGAQAEAAGRALARDLAQTGRDAELIIIVRGGQVVARFPFGAQAAA